MMGGSGISGTICKSSAPNSRQTTMQASHHCLLQPGCSSYHPTNSIKAPKAQLADSNCWNIALLADLVVVIPIII